MSDIAFDEPETELPEGADVSAPEKAPEPAETPSSEEQSVKPAAESTEPERPVTPEFTDEQQAFLDSQFQMRAGRARARLGEAEDRIAEQQRVIEELQSQLPQIPENGPVVPPEPEDFWATDYQEKMAEHKQAMVDRAIWEREQEQQAQQQAEIEQQQQQQRQAVIQQKLDIYQNKAKAAGIDPTALSVAEETIVQVGMDPTVAMHIVNDDQGWAINLWLSKNLEEVTNLQKMDPMTAAVHIATVIKPKAMRANKPKEKLPDPVHTEKGAGVAEKQRGPVGATYE